MNLLLHAGHEHTETATSATSTASQELTVAAILGILLGAAVLVYAIKQYSAA